ncbi:hypothetical protein SCHPADRAFT_942611 [Schizopora paradoxa]|uniref:Uncharacterized protein n=1 Tax=Schizopora paradoxa TaxID=27342 RepID=A0A0H2RFU0_9AGAM|nr:hypothetical protein SCHPADRAFT_942611 [Schizopora paradoxa]
MAYLLPMPFMLVFHLLLGVHFVVAKYQSNVQCLPSSAYLYNSNLDSPCEIWASLSSVCSDESELVSINPIPSGAAFYVSEITPENQLCQCSTVLYVMMVACSACQNTIWNASKWRDWSKDCSGTSERSAMLYQRQPAFALFRFPASSDPPLKVPQWAFADVLYSNAFDLQIAKYYAEGVSEGSHI